MASTNKTRSAARNRRHVRVRQTVSGTPSRPRLCVFRSLSGIYAQVIDDVAGNTLVSASTIDTSLRDQVKGLKQAEKAHLVGKTLAERAISKGIQEVSFDRTCKSISRRCARRRPKVLITKAHGEKYVRLSNCRI
jgi:large subunit ribosomal protein L18